VTEGAREQGQEVGGMSRRTLLFALGRVAGWLIVPLYVAGNCAFYLLRRGAGLGNGTNLLDDVEGAVLNVGFAAFAVVGALLVAKRSTNLIGWIMAAIALMVAIFNAGGAYATYVMLTRGQPDALAVVGAWTANCYWFVMLALALFTCPCSSPTGTYRPGVGSRSPCLRGSRRRASSFVLPRAFMDTLPLNEAPGYRIDNPIGIEGLGSVENLPLFGVLLNGLLVIAFVGAAASVVVRFRRSRGVERLQMKWFVYVTVVLVGGSILTSVIGVATGLRWLEQFSFVLSMVGLVGLPIAVGISIFRYRLYEIDVVINRTLVYGLLTLLLALMYFGGIVLLQRVFVLLTGQQSTLAVVASTLLIAALFNPLRGRIQAFIDRAFYRRKYDARKTLQAFSATLRDETDLNALSADLVGMVRETMQPAHVSLWLRTETAQKGEQTH
jgi:hypothetical protein